MGHHGDFDRGTLLLGHRQALTQVSWRRESAIEPDGGSQAVGDKSPKKENAKKPSKSLKEKRSDKQAKRSEKRSGYGN